MCPTVYFVRPAVKYKTSDPRNCTILNYDRRVSISEN